jgi:DNA helicase-2/ATP-dependent DNA helicase PcrA
VGPMCVSHDPTGTLEDIGRRDHSFTSEYRIYGPPGAGKTTSLARQIHRAVDKYGSAAVLVTSFSRAAAAELAGRNLPLDRDHVGTLHSFCYRALGRPRIAEADVEEWNQANPHLPITPASRQRKLDGEEVGEDAAERGREGDSLLQQLNRLRGRMVQVSGWPCSVRQFHSRWQDYKQAHHLLDFTDLIEVAAQSFAVAPGNPSVIFADEAQDLNPMQLGLVRKWGERAAYFILAGDDDQTIYSFTGAVPDAILDPDIPGDHKIILKQSYRVPRAVHQISDRLIRQVTRRQDKPYLPRPEDGAVERISTGGYKSPEYYILKSAVEHIEAGRTVMFLTACAYMLTPVIAVLRRNGIPFYNPYRRSNGFWNPLRLASSGSSANRILALVAAHPDYGGDLHLWTYGDLASWTEWLAGDHILKPGAAQKIISTKPTTPVMLGDLIEVFQPEALDCLMTAYEGGSRKLVQWWRGRVGAAFHGRIQFPADVVALRGPHALLDTPKVVVGTIHSVKGGQADVVYLFPDLSRSGDAGFNQGGADRDAVIRLFYVGMTRAREKLYICQPESFSHIRF